MNSQNLNIHEISHPHIVQKLSLKTIFISVVTFFVGICSIYVCYIQENTKSPLSMIFLLTGIGLIAYGLFFFTKLRQNIYIETGSVVRSKSYNFEKNKLEHMKVFISQLSQGDSLKAKPITFSDNGNAKIDVIISADNKFAAVQLFEFIPYSFEPITPVYYFTNQHASDFISYLNSCKTNNTN